MPGSSFPTTYPMLYCADIGATADFLTQLGLDEVWRIADDDGVVEHAEMRWANGLVSLNLKTSEFEAMGPGTVALRCTAREQVDQVHTNALAAGADIFHALDDSFIAYNFTLQDTDGHLYWVHFENGVLDQVRG